MERMNLIVSAIANGQVITQQLPANYYPWEEENTKYSNGFVLLQYNDKAKVKGTQEQRVLNAKSRWITQEESSSEFNYPDYSIAYNLNLPKATSEIQRMCFLKNSSTYTPHTPQ